MVDHTVLYCCPQLWEITTHPPSGGRGGRQEKEGRRGQRERKRIVRGDM